MNTSNKHFINFGTAKTASSWLYNNLMTSPAIDYQGIKEPGLHIARNLESYNKYFENSQFSLNFNVSSWRLDSNQINQISSRATHKSIIFRNPYTYANSLYNFWQLHNWDSDNFLDSFIQFFDYANIIKRLPADILILYYDDIKNSPQYTMNQITDYLEIDTIAISENYVNVTNYQKNLTFDPKYIMLLNNFIDTFQDSVKKNLSHWKMDV